MNDDFDFPKKKRRRFSDFLKETQDRPHIDFPPIGPLSVRLVVQSSPRAAKCRVCGEVIPAKGERLMAYVIYRFRKRFGDASWPGDRFHYHIGCVSPILKGEKTASTNGCLSCSTTVSEKWVMVRLSGQAPYGRLCAACSDRTEFKRCEICRVLFPHGHVFRVIADYNEDDWYPKLRKGDSVCSQCEHNFGIATTRSKKKHTEFLQSLNEATQEIAQWLDRQD